MAILSISVSGDLAPPASATAMISRAWQAIKSLIASWPGSKAPRATSREGGRSGPPRSGGEADRGRAEGERPRRAEYLSCVVCLTAPALSGSPPRSLKTAASPASGCLDICGEGRFKKL